MDQFSWEGIIVSNLFSTSLSSEWRSIVYTNFGYSYRLLLGFWNCPLCFMTLLPKSQLISFLASLACSCRPSLFIFFFIKAYNLCPCMKNLAYLRMNLKLVHSLLTTSHFKGLGSSPLENLSKSTSSDKHTIWRVS